MPDNVLFEGGAGETVRRKLLAHEFTVERFVVGPLRDLTVLDAGQLAALGDELDQLSQDAEAVAAFVRDVPTHIERKTRAVAPAARSALAEGRLSPVPRWYVEEVYGQQGDPGAHPPEEWLG